MKIITGLKGSEKVESHFSSWLKIVQVFGSNAFIRAFPITERLSAVPKCFYSGPKQSEREKVTYQNECKDNDDLLKTNRDVT